MPSPSATHGMHAVGAMLASAGLFAVMTVAAKMLANPRYCRPLPAAEVTLIRFAFGVLVMLPLLGRRDVNLLGTDRLGLVWRGLSGGVAVLTYFIAIEHTTLTNAVLLNLTSTVFAPVNAAIFLKESLSLGALPTFGLATAGVLLVIRPGPGGQHLGDLYGLLSGFLAGTAITAVRRLRRHESASSVFFYFSLIGVPVSLIACLGRPMVLPDAAGWGLLFLMASASVGAQLLMTYGYRYVRTSEGVLLMLSQVAYSAVIGVLVFGERLSALTLLGGVCIMAATVWSARAASR